MESSLLIDDLRNRNISTLKKASSVHSLFKRSTLPKGFFFGEKISTPIFIRCATTQSTPLRLSIERARFKGKLVRRLERITFQNIVLI